MEVSFMDTILSYICYIHIQLFFGYYHFLPRKIFFFEGNETKRGNNQRSVFIREHKQGML